MWTPQFRASNALPPQCMGFYQVWRNQLHWIGHEGDLIAFHSLFFVESEQRLVLFVSYNSAGGGDKPRPEIIRAFSDRYFPGAPQVTFLNPYPRELRDIEGTYLETRRADSTRLRIFNLTQDRASVDKDGNLILASWKDLRGHTLKFRPIGKDLWQAVDDQRRIFAIRDSRNRVIRIALDFPGVQMERVPLYENGNLVRSMAGVSLGICALVLLATLIRVGRRVFLGRRPRLMPQPGTIWLTFFPRTAAILWILFAAAIEVGLKTWADGQIFPNPEWYRWFTVMNWVTGVALLLSLFAVISAIRIWWQSHTRWITKIKFSLVGAACVVLSLFAVYYHLIGPARRI
jgi:hypothetical protein